MTLNWSGIIDRLVERVPSVPGDGETFQDGSHTDDLDRPLLVMVHPDVVQRVDLDLRQPDRANRCAEIFAHALETWDGDIAILLGDSIDAIADMDTYARLKHAIDNATAKGAHVWITPETSGALSRAGIDLVEKYNAHTRPSVTFAGGFADDMGGCLAHAMMAYETAGGMNADVSDAVVVAHGQVHTPSYDNTAEHTATPTPR